MKKSIIFAAATLAVCLTSFFFMAGCGNDAANAGQSDTLLVVDTIVGEDSDVVFADQQISVGGSCNDNAVVTLSATLKTPDGTSSFYNDVIVNGYEVEFRRVDGATSVPGVNVPFPFAGNVTFKIPAGGSSDFAFVVVRHNTKLEPPVESLCCNGETLVVSARCTFFGEDLTGANVSAWGSVEIHFANFGDADTECP